MIIGNYELLKRKDKVCVREFRNKPAYPFSWEYYDTRLTSRLEELMYIELEKLGYKGYLSPIKTNEDARH